MLRDLYSMKRRLQAKPWTLSIKHQIKLINSLMNRLTKPTMMMRLKRLQTKHKLRKTKSDQLKEYLNWSIILSF